MLHTIRAFATSALLLTSILSTLSAHATIVRIETSLGDIDVNLFDEDTPLTVANFLSYVDAGSYDGTFIHRSIPGFIIQTGGYSYEGLNSSGNLILPSVSRFSAVSNEPVYSNLRGTIAMAKLGGYPDSATSEWFFNLADNASNLDGQNEGFTVFGQVVSGMSTVDAITALTHFDLGGAFTDLPLRDFTNEDANAGEIPDDTNFVEIESVTIIDTTMDTASSLSPVLNTTVSDDDDDDDSSGGGGGGGGSSAPWLVLSLGILVLLRRRFAVISR